jgi:hypothetical protein
MHRLRQLFASATGRRIAAALAGVLLLAQLAAAGHLHLPAPDQDRGGSHALCELCVAADRAGVAPPAPFIALPPAAAEAVVRVAIAAVPVAPAPGGYSSRAPPFSLV